MEDGTKIILEAIIKAVSRMEGGDQFARDLSHDLSETVEELLGHPVTQRDVSYFAHWASKAQCSY